METVANMAAADTCSWQEGILERLQDLQHGFVEKADAWLDYLAAIDVTTKTSSNDATWSEEWNQFASFGAWPQWETYRQVFWTAMMDGWQGIQSVVFWVWLSVQPMLFSVAYLGFRFLQVTVGAFLPYFQRVFVTFCRFHLHLTWQALLGEVSLVCAVILVRKIYRWCKTQQHTTRARRYVTNKWNKVKRSIQSTYREIAQISLLLAMAIPHVAYMGLVLCAKVLYPSWVAKVSTETMAPALFKFWYPIVATIVVLHHSRAFVGSSKTKTKTANKSKATKKNKRRRSSLGALIRGTAPGSLPDGQHAGGDDRVEYTEEELTEDVCYWLNYWLLYSSLKMFYILATKAYFVGALMTSDTMHSVLSQLEFLFYIWIFCLPQCLQVLFPSAGDEERRDWSKSKQWCYNCALNPVLEIPGLFTRIVVPCFYKVSHAVPPPEWKKYVVDFVKKTLDVASFMKMLSEERVEAIIDHLTNFRPMIVPAITLVMPGFATQYGVLYVQFIVPQAHSFEALELKARHNTQRILYLKFWVIHAFASVLINWAHTLFWIVPLKMHMTFILWCVLVMPRLISSIYDEFDRELQAFHLLPPVADGLSVENTYTARSLSIIYNALPKAADVDGNTDTKQTGDGGSNSGGQADTTGDSVKDGTLMDDNNSTAILGGNEGTVMVDTVTDDVSAKTDTVKRVVGTMHDNKADAVAKLAQDHGEKENNMYPSAKVDDDLEPSSSKSKQAKDPKVSSDDSARRRRSNRLKRPSN